MLGARQLSAHSSSATAAGRAHLDTMPDPAEAHRRRGAAFTFDGEAYATFLASVRESIRADGLSILAPSFSHELKDPTPDAIAILPHHRIVIFEGLYVLLDVEPWRRAARMLDERWIVTVTRDTARRRLIKRYARRPGILRTPDGSHTGTSRPASHRIRKRQPFAVRISRSKWTLCRHPCVQLTPATSRTATRSSLI
jgi:pantothenate kinase